MGSDLTQDMFVGFRIQGLEFGGRRRDLGL